jgi:aspartate/methionine/tyrosine aminotransferase
MLQRVRLVGALPKLVPLRGDASGWRLDLEALQAAVSDRTRVLFLMNPAIPSGWVANDEEWAAITGICREREIMLLYWMLWEAVVFGGRPIVVPSGLDGMRDLTVTAGAVSLEQRMIGWRVGWTVSRAELAPTLAMVHIYNGVVTSGFGQIGAAAALRLGDDDVGAAVAEWEHRHEELVRQCDGLPLVPAAHGGWSALFDAEACGLDALELSRRLLKQKVAATPMTDAWGVRWQRGMYGSSSATSRSSVSRCSASGCAPRSRDQLQLGREEPCAGSIPAASMICRFAGVSRVALGNDFGITRREPPREVEQLCA